MQSIIERGLVVPGVCAQLGTTHRDLLLSEVKTLSIYLLGTVSTVLVTHIKKNELSLNFSIQLMNIIGMNIRLPY